MLLLITISVVSHSANDTSAAPSGEEPVDDFVSFSVPSMLVELDFKSNNVINMRINIRDGRNRSQPLSPANWTEMMSYANMNAINAQTIISTMLPYNGTQDYIRRGILRSTRNISCEIDISRFEMFCNETLHIIKIEANLTYDTPPPWSFKLLSFLDAAPKEKAMKKNPRQVYLTIEAKCNYDTWFYFSPAPDEHTRTWDGESLRMSEKCDMYPMNKKRWTLEVDRGQYFNARFLMISLIISESILLPLLAWRILRLFRKREIFTIAGFIFLAITIFLATTTPLFYYYPGFTVETLFTMIIVQAVLPFVLFIPRLARSRDRFRGYAESKLLEKRRMKEQLSEAMGITPDEVENMVREIRKMAKKGKRPMSFSTAPDFAPELEKKDERDPYKILGITPTDDVEKINAAFRKMTKQYHPDQYEALPDRMKEFAQHELKKIIWAYESLNISK